MNLIIAAEFSKTKTKSLDVLQFSNVQKQIDEKRKEKKSRYKIKKISFFTFQKLFYFFLPPAMTAMIALF